MTDHDLEQRLRAWYQVEVSDRGGAPHQLRTDLAAIVTAPAQRDRSFLGDLVRLPRRRLAPTLLIAAAGLAGALVGAALLAGPPVDISPSPVPSTTPAPSRNASPGPTVPATFWTPTGSLIRARYNPTATLLANGKVLVMGADPRGATSPLAELYDPDSGTWSPTGSRVDFQTSTTATVMRDGRVLVACGATDRALIYDPVAESWRSTGHTVHTWADGCSATLLPSGNVLIAGAGYKFGSVTPTPPEIYDPVTETWTTTGKMVAPRTDQTATLLTNGTVLVTGGADPRRGPIASAELFDPATETWTATGNMGGARSGHTATLLPDGTVLAIGGNAVAESNSLRDSVELYDPATGSWSPHGSIDGARMDHKAILLPDGRVLVLDGYFGGEVTTPYAGIYDPNHGPLGYGDWVTLPNPLEVRTGAATTLLAGGRVLIAGGWDMHADPNPLITAELYDFGPGR